MHDINEYGDIHTDSIIREDVVQSGRLNVMFPLIALTKQYLFSYLYSSIYLLFSIVKWYEKDIIIRN